MSLEKYPPDGWSEEDIERYVWRKFGNEMITSYRLAIRAKTWSSLISTLHGLKLDAAALTFETLYFKKPEFMCTIDYRLSAPHSKDSVEARTMQLASNVLHQQCKALAAEHVRGGPTIELYTDDDSDPAFAIAGWTRVDVNGPC